MKCIPKIKSFVFFKSLFNMTTSKFKIILVTRIPLLLNNFPDLQVFPNLALSQIGSPRV
jgi:hypothetical protein